MDASKRYEARPVSPGIASGPALVIKERLSLKGTVDPASGVIRKPGTSLDGCSIANKVLFFISGKGSSSWSGYFKMACRHKNSPLAIVNLEIDPLVASACVFNNIPLVQARDPAILEEIENGNFVTVDANRGSVLLHKGDESNG
jgi:uncharacterized protein